MITLIIGGGISHVAGGINVFMPHNLKISIHVQTTLTVARGVDLCR